MKKFCNSLFKSVQLLSVAQIFFIFFLVLFFIYTYCIQDNLNLNNLANMINDSDSDKAKSVLEVNNIKINGFEFAMEHIRDGAIWIGGMSAAAKIAKGSSLPVGAKFGATIGMGAASLLSYKMIQNNLSNNQIKGTIGIEANKLNNSISTSISKANDNPLIKKLVDGSSDSDNMVSLVKDNFTISAKNVEQLQLDLYLQYVIIYLLIILLVFLIMKKISEHDIKLEFLKNIPLIQGIFFKLFKWWGKTNIIWVYLILINILVCMMISAWSLHLIINNLS